MILTTCSYLATVLCELKLPLIDDNNRHKFSIKVFCYIKVIFKKKVLLQCTCFH